MPHPTRKVKPRQRAALSTFQAIVATAIILGPLLLSSGSEHAEGSPFLGNMMLLSFAFLVVTGIWHLATHRSPEKEIRDYRVTLEDDHLVQRDPRGDEIARIDVSRPYEYRVLKEVPDFGIYRLYQDDTELTFSSDDPNASTVVPDVLGLRWPPVDHVIFWSPLWRNRR